MDYLSNNNFAISFCFISQTGEIERPILDASVRYRCFHIAEELRYHNYYSTVTSLNQFLISPCFDYDVYIFHRPTVSPHTKITFDTILKLLKQKGKILIADYDGLIFGDEKIAAQSSAVKNNRITLKEAHQIFLNNLAGLLIFDKVLTSTTALANWVKHFHPTAGVKVLPNFIPTSLLTFHGQRQSYLKKRAKGTIGYFAGTKSHDKDFPIVAEALYRTLKEQPDFNLLIVGLVKVPYILTGLKNVVINPVIDYFRLASLMWTCETVIAPLEKSDFNNCKSRVKFLEASLAGCRLVATPITDMVDVGENHIYFANETDEWYQLLSLSPNSAEILDLQQSNFDFISKHKSIEALLTFCGEIL